MALIKEYTTELGTTGSYWRADLISVNKGMGFASFGLYCYVSKAIADKNPNNFIHCFGVGDLLEAKDKTLFNKYFDEKGVNYKDVYTACYMFAKDNIEFFKDAQDDPEEVARMEVV